MDPEVLALRALADLREAAAGLAEELGEERGTKRVWVDPYIREDGERVTGYWREGGAELRKAGDVIDPGPGERPPWNPPLHPNIAQRVKTEHLDSYPPYGETAKKILGAAKDTQDLYSYVDDNGDRHYSAERAKRHDEIIDYFLASHSGEKTFDQPMGVKGKKRRSRKNPIVLFFAGGTASGKTSALNEAQASGALGDFIPDDPVMINPDLIKQMLPEFREMANAGERAASSVLHEESSDIAKRLRERAVNAKFNVIVDGTGDSGKTKFLRKLWDAADEGYDVRVFMVDLPVNVAIERAVLRGDNEEKGRYVPVPEIEKSHYGSAARHYDWRNLKIISRWQVWSNNVPPGQKPILIAEGGDGRFEVKDKYEYSRLEEKASHSEV